MNLSKFQEQFANKEEPGRILVLKEKYGSRYFSAQNREELEAVAEIISTEYKEGFLRDLGYLVDSISYFGSDINEDVLSRLKSSGFELQANSIRDSLEHRNKQKATLADRKLIEAEYLKEKPNYLAILFELRDEGIIDFYFAVLENKK